MALTARARRQFQSLFEVITTGLTTVDPAAFVDDESQLITVTVPGAALGDFVLVAPGVDLAEAVVTAYVSAADTVKICIAHVGGDTTNLASSSWRIIVLRGSTQLFK